MRKTFTITRAVGVLAVAGALGACGTSGTTAQAGTSPGFGVDAAAASGSTSPATQTQATHPKASSTSSPKTSKKPKTPNASRGSYCGAVTAVDAARRTITFTGIASYNYGGESPTIVHRETGTFVASVARDVTLTDHRSVDPNIKGSLRAKLAYAEREGSGSDRIYLELAGVGGAVTNLAVNRVVPGAVRDGCEDTQVRPDPTRNSYCGVIRFADARSHLIAFDAYTSYTYGGESPTFVRTEDDTITATVAESMTVTDAADGGRKVSGSLASRLAYARDAARGRGRAYLEISEGRVLDIRVNNPEPTQQTSGCVDDR